MGKLILTSNGFNKSDNTSDKIIEQYATNQNILFVDNATLTGSNIKNIKIIISNFKQIAKSVNQFTITKENYKNIFAYDVLYFTGGDLSPLIEIAKNNAIKEALLLFLKSNKTIIGESAGSIIFGDDLKYYYDIKRGTKPKYDIDLKNYKGFNFVNINIFPHWNKVSEELKNKVFHYEKEKNIEIKKLEDEDFVVVNI